MTLEILEKIRVEKKFESIEKLKIQLDIDKRHCQKLIPEYLVYLNYCFHIPL